MLAMRVIRFKSHTQCDEFVLLWNTSYRLANIFFTFFSISLFQAIQVSQLYLNLLSYVLSFDSLAVCLASCSASERTQVSQLYLIFLPCSFDSLAVCLESRRLHSNIGRWGDSSECIPNESRHTSNWPGNNASVITVALIDQASSV